MSLRAVFDTNILFQSFLPRGSTSNSACASFQNGA